MNSTLQAILKWKVMPIKAYLTTHPDMEEVTLEVEEQWYRDVVRAGMVIYGCITLAKEGYFCIRM